jgi:hypothetical protein
MIVIWVDVHKHELTAVAVDELGRELACWSGPAAASRTRASRSPEQQRLEATADVAAVLERPQPGALERADPAEQSLSVSCRDGRSGSRRACSSLPAAAP